MRWRLPRRDFSSPQTRSGVRFLGWLLWQQLPLLLLSSLLSVIEWLPGSVGPYLVGKIVDDGILPGDLAVVGRLSLIMFGLVVIGIVASVLGHTLVVRTWLVAMYGSMKLVTRKATQMGHVLPQRTPTGEVLSYCRYNMPTGPNRSATVRYSVDEYNLTVIDHFANGQSFVSVTGMGFSGSKPAVSWSPSCNTL